MFSHFFFFYAKRGESLTFGLFISVNIHVIYLIYKYLTCIFLIVFTLREPCKNTSAAEKGKIILSGIKKVIKSHFPDIFDRFNLLTDNRKRKEYSMAEIVTGALFMFIFKETSRNSYNNDRRETCFRKNFYKLFGFNLPHGDTLDEVLCELPPGEFEILKATLVGGLIEQKILRKFRFLGKFYLVAVDGTGMATFEEKHCEHCLSKTSKNGITTYFHYVLEAKIVTTSGLSISLASEFVENVPGRDYDKQDCEQKAFVRLAAKIKKFFPRLAICILADGLYPNNNVFDICIRNNWAFIINLKDGNLKTVQTEVSLMRATAQKKFVYRKNKSSRTTLEYSYLNEIEYSGHYYSWVECKEDILYTKDNSTVHQRFVYITNIAQDKDNVIETADSGRLRWKIENEGFNTQKNLGYALEHKYSRNSFPAMQNYYQIMQIAHMINQMAEQSRLVVELLTEHSKQTIADLWKKLIAYLTMISVDQEYQLPKQPG
jgi:hypothetical protein